MGESESFDFCSTWTPASQEFSMLESQIKGGKRILWLLTLIPGRILVIISEMITIQNFFGFADSVFTVLGILVTLDASLCL